MKPFHKLMVLRFLRRTTSQETVDWAYAELLAGYDTPNLRILAGLRPPFDSWEVDFYFRATLDELGRELEDGEQFLREYALEVARGIVSGALSPIPASREIYEIYTNMNYDIGLSNWFYIADGIDPHTYCLLNEETLQTAIEREAQRMLEEDSEP